MDTQSALKSLNARKDKEKEVKDSNDDDVKTSQRPVFKLRLGTQAMTEQNSPRVSEDG
jgi:hypothetical protein